MAKFDQFYPQEDETDLEVVRTTVVLPEDVIEDLRLISQVWNELDRVLKPPKKGRKKWVSQRVIERAVRTLVADFWEKAAGGARPVSEVDRQELINNYLERLRQERDAK